MHSIKLKDMIGYSILLLFLIFPSNIISFVNYKTACELLKLPRDCHCQRTRGVPISTLNETRLRCRQLTKLTTDFRWSIVPYDRLAFEIPNGNLTLNRFAFVDLIARTIRFDAQNLFLNDHAFYNAYIGQLAISHTDNYGTINFEHNGQIFYGTTVTNIFIKLMNFQKPISEIIFSNIKMYAFVVQSSKFFGFTNRKLNFNQTDENLNNNNNNNNNDTNKHIHFLEYDFMLTTGSSIQTNNQTTTTTTPPLKIRRKKKKKISRDISESNDEYKDYLSDETVTINITSINLPAFIRIYTILSSINTTNLTENYFPNNIEYSETDEIELSYNYIYSLDAHAFRNLQFFEGRLILTYNHIHFISLYAFTDLYSINNLSLSNNNIQNLTSKHFENLKQLYELDLSFNSIEQLNKNLFQSLSNLHILNLNNNPLKYIDSNIFMNLTHLKEIYLQNVNLIDLINPPSHSNWIWNLASLHINYLLNTNFDLSDVAFCLLSRFNQTFFHLSRQHSCSCNVHYLHYTPDLYQNMNNSSLIKYHTNYLRLTPICNLNETFEENENNTEQIQSLNKTDIILLGLEDQCDYKLIFLDCDAMTTTTTTTTEITTIFETTVELSTTTPWYYKYTKPPKRSVNSVKKLFTVLGTLVAITIAAIILVILWYRLKTVYKRREKQKKILEQQKSFNTRSNNNLFSTGPRYVSSDMLSSLPSTQFTDGKNQSQILITPTSIPATVYKNIDALTNDSIQSYIDDENQQQQNIINDETIDIEANTQC